MEKLEKKQEKSKNEARKRFMNDINYQNKQIKSKKLNQTFR